MTVTSAAQAGLCARCGCDLTASAALTPPVEPEPEALDAALIGDLREAFGATGGLWERDRPAGWAAERPVADADALLPPATLRPHTRLGDFEILGELGRGGMGVVYRARQISLGRDVALKILPGYAQHGTSAVQRFRAEAQAAARIHHTNVVPIYAQGEHGGHYYYAMELINGVGLDTVIRSRPDLLSLCGTGFQPVKSQTRSLWRKITGKQPVPQDFRHIAGLFAEVADALDCAHRQGVIHRDVKPHNLLLGTSDSDLRLGGSDSTQAGLTQRLHLTDFGLARLTDGPHLTVSGEVLGTPAYLSPEQVRGHPAGIDHRTDIYSLGVTLYEVLTHRKPFDGETRDEIMAGISTAEPLPPRRIDPRIPLDLETICLRAIEKDPGQRHPTATLLSEDLRRFANGRPILSRRTSRLRKAGKWVRRHKAVTVALAAAAVILVLAGGWAWNARATRQREARRMLDHAYAQLAYYDFGKPELVDAEIDRAAALGADAEQVHLVRALAAMGHNQPAEAIKHVNHVLAKDPADLRARYLLSWAQYRSRDWAGARATFLQAEQLRQRAGGGAPAELPPDAWFFRGLAVHFEDPVAAINSYREANAVRARQHAFYPQAVLHLARARNQELYSLRSLEPFSEAQASLRLLAEQGYYEARPYYLLSITHRLAAEMYKGSQGTRGEQPVTENYAAALDWARRGQQVDPTDDRPVTAEAECLESMGRYDEAIAARSRAIAIANADIKRCEGLHYRWRLYYWTGDLDAAAADLHAHAACDPNNPFYAHVFPALLAAEVGDMPAALAHARALAADTASDGTTSAAAVLRAAMCLRLLGRGAEAAELLAARANAVDYAADLVPPQTEEWMRALYAYCVTGGSTENLELLAQQVATPWKLSGEALFHAGALLLAEGDRSRALATFQRAYLSFDGEERYTYFARLLCVQMQKNLAWPQWIPVSWDGAPAAAEERAEPAATRPAPAASEERSQP
jgi:serine/threonine protein kinase/Flp pilus assembly protein TadD